MLKRIVFLISDSSLNHQKVRDAVMETKNYIEECGYESEIIAFKNKDGVSVSHEKKDKEVVDSTLYITDDGRLSEEMLGEGYYVLGMTHDFNGKEEFPSARYIFSDISEIDIDSFVKAYQRYAGEPWEVMRTERLLVRETTLDDIEEFYRLYSDPEMTRYMEGLFEDPEDEKRYQRDYIKKVYGLMGFGIWTLVRLTDGRIIGRAGYSVRSGFEEVELGFLVGTEYQRKGYATEACRAILDYGRDVLKFEKVQTLVKAENTVSIHMCERLGFLKVEEVDVEENIYGESYKEGQKATPSKERCGKYVRMVKALKID